MLVAGADGFLGLNCIHGLQQLGAEISTVTRRASPRCPHVSGQIFRGDLCDPGLSRTAVKGQSIVFDFLGSSGAAQSNEEPIRSLDEELRAQLNLMLACAQSGDNSPLLMFCSSRLVYGRPRYLPVDEQHELMPQSVYAAHKIAAENYLGVFARAHGLRYCIVRLSNPYGPYQSNNGQAYGVINQFLRAAARGEPIRVYGEGRQRRDYIHVNDAITAFLQCAAHELCYGQILNLGGQTVISLGEAAQWIAKLAGTAVEFVPWPQTARSVETGDYITDRRKMESLVSLPHQVSLDEGLAGALAHYRAEANAAQQNRRLKPFRPLALVEEKKKEQPMKTQEYVGVILAAGRGSRMAPFSDNYPKPILPICNRPLIQHHIEVMRSIGLREVVVLVGHKGFEISKVLGDGSKFGVSIRYAEQTSTLGIAHAVGCLEALITKPFLLLLGDIFFVPAGLEQMFSIFEEQGGGGVLATKEESNPQAICKNFSLTLSPDGRVVKVVEKPRHTTNRLKGVGIYLFDLPIFDAIRRTPRTAMRDEYEITDSIQVMIEDGYPVRPCNSVLEDINLTTPADLLLCNLLQARQIPQAALIGRDTCLHGEVQLDRCVIGDEVTVRHPISISQSVIFDGTCVDSRTNFRNHILTPHGAVDCSHGLEAVPTRLWTTVTASRA